MLALRENSLKADQTLNLIGSVDYKKALCDRGVEECLALENSSKRTALYSPFRRKTYPPKRVRQLHLQPAHSKEKHCLIASSPFPMPLSIPETHTARH